MKFGKKKTLFRAASPELSPVEKRLERVKVTLEEARKALNDFEAELYQDPTPDNGLEDRECELWGAVDNLHRAFAHYEASVWLIEEEEAAAEPEEEEAKCASSTFRPT